MNIIVENKVVFDDVVAMLPEAQKQFESLSKTFDGDEIQKIVENLAKTEPNLAIAIGSLMESDLQLNEFIVKRVSSKGEVTRVKDKETRKRQATQTTGLSKSARRQIARKAAKTRKANPSKVHRANKIRKKTMKKRKMLGLST